MDCRTVVMQEDLQVTEKSLREALERLGSKTKISSQNKVDNNGLEGTNKQYYPGNLSNTNPITRRRRFVNDGGVVVERRNDLGRNNKKALTSYKNNPERSNAAEEQEEVRQLKRSLQKEQLRSQAMDTNNSELKNKIKSQETHLFHYRTRVEELEKSLTLLKNENLKYKLLLEKREKPSAPSPVKKVRTKKTFETQNDENLQPVKWWVEE
ncbi:hypothetical protein [Aristophania vespae]|uniref:hypothetical protein n=1 Tax=Aristophania vespae TaxID=2697033 RepID=UPI0023516B21|nr:hypothetical protein [Aristophania vespae]